MDPSGCSNNPTKSLCSPSVFNTAITRAKSLVVAVGNPYTLMAVEEKLDKSKQCWAKYLNQCFSANTIRKSPGITDDGAVQELQQFVKQALNELPSMPSATPNPSVQEEGIESSPTHIQKRSPAPVKASSSSQIQANSPVVQRPPVQSQQAVSKVASSQVKEKRDTFMVVNSFTPTGREIYVELSLHGATSQNTTIKTTGPFPDRSQALSNSHCNNTPVEANISQMKDSGCVVCLPPQNQPGVFAVTVSSGAFQGMFLLNVFNANAVEIVSQPVKSKVDQKQMWVADCTKAGPGILVAIASNKNTRTRTTIEYSPVSGLHTISFSPTEAGPYTLEMIYNGHDTGNTLRFNVQQ